MSDRSAAPLTDLHGGRYRLVTEIARGGMATVYRAHDEVLDRDVAVKILHDHLADDPTFLERFRREARAAAALNHPNIVAVYDWGEDDDGAFLVMELVEGLSLRDVLRIRGRLSPRELLALLGPVAQALGAAHHAGLVHRDVKPDNVLLSHTGTVKVTDFGLARAAASSTHTFGSDVIVGSPHYLAPEAVDGRPLTPASDVYSLGVLIYECLTGAPPFQGETAMATALQHTAQRVPPPSVTPEVDGRLDPVVATATAPDPDERFTDGTAVAEALHQAVPEGPVTVDLRDGRHHTVVLPVNATETVVPTPDPPRARRTRPPQAASNDGEAAAERPAATPRRRRWVRRLVALLLLGVAAGFGLWAFVLAPVTDVPPVDGLPEDQARAKLEDAGFEVGAATHQHSLDVAAGHVVDHRPDGSARKGTTITLVLSDGPAQLTLPSVDGRTEDEAVATLTELGVVPVVEGVFHDTVPEGQAIATDPPAQSVVDEASTVRLLVSKGREPIEVPSVVGDRADQATEQLEALGFDPVVVQEVFSDDVPEGAVVEQAPEPGATLYRGDQVRLTVSKGPEGFEMPDVVGGKEGEARKALEKLGLVVRVEKVSAFFRPKGRVADQDPEAGTQVHRGDTVTLFVWD